MANVNIELNIAGARVYFTIQNRLKYIAQKSKKVSIDRGRTSRDGEKPGQKPFFWKPARTPGQGHKKRTCPGKPGRMVTLVMIHFVLIHFISDTLCCDTFCHILELNNS